MELWVDPPATDSLKDTCNVASLDKHTHPSKRMSNILQRDAAV